MIRGWAYFRHRRALLLLQEIGHLVMERVLNMFDLIINLLFSDPIFPTF